jgi:hypothetical protein
LRDFGLLESGREDKKRLISGFIFIMPLHGSRLAAVTIVDIFCHFLRLQKAYGQWKLSPLLARLR